VKKAKDEDHDELETENEPRKLQSGGCLSATIVVQRPHEQKSRRNEGTLIGEEKRSWRKVEKP